MASCATQPSRNTDSPGCRETYRFLTDDDDDDDDHASIFSSLFCSFRSFRLVASRNECEMRDES